VNQLGSELVLKGGDLLANCRLTDSTLLRDSREASFFSYADENLHRIELVQETLPVPLHNPFYTSTCSAVGSDAAPWVKRPAFLLEIIGIPRSAESA